MQFFKPAVARDAVIALAWVAATAWLKLAARMRLTRLRLPAVMPGAPTAVAEVCTLERLAERSEWRCETLAALHADALAAIAEAEADCAQVRAQLARVRPAGDDPQPAEDAAGDAPLAA
jgi:hypothetical protein